MITLYNYNANEPRFRQAILRVIPIRAVLREDRPHLEELQRGRKLYLRKNRKNGNPTIMQNFKKVMNKYGIKNEKFLDRLFERFKLDKTSEKS